MSTSATLLGAWRDRTNLYISYRQSYGHSPPTRRKGYLDEANGDPYSESAGLISNADGGDAIIEMDLLPPRWLDIQDEITQMLGEISSKMRRLEQMHAKHVLPGFDDERVKQIEGRDIEALTQEITKGFTDCQKSIRRVDTMVREQQAGGSGLSQADEKMARNLKVSLASRVSDVSTIFRKKQSMYLKKMRSLGGLGSPLDRASTPLAQNPYTDPALIETESDVSTAQASLQQASQLRRRQGVHDAQIEQREREIERIAQGVIDLSHIFQELNAMVIDQGTILDRIDYNVERTAEHVKEAEKELKVATGYQKKSTKRKIILLLILIVAGLFILLLVRPRKVNGGDGWSSPTLPPESPGLNDPGADLPPRKVVELETSDLGWTWKQRRRRQEFMNCFSTCV